MAKLRRTLLIEDDRVDQMAFKRLVKDENLPYDYIIAGSLKEAKEILQSGQKFDVIIMDYQLGDGTSLELLDTIGPLEAPIIFSTGAGDEEVAVQAMKSGVADYLIKDDERNYLKVLEATIENAIKRKQADDQIRMLSQVVMSTTDSIYVADMTDNIIFVNQAFCHNYGYSEAEILGQPVKVLQGEATLPQPDEEPRELYHQRANGEQFPISLSQSIVKNDEGQAIAMVGVAHDITERKRVEQELRDLNASKDKFFSIISHDLRSPFTHLIGYSYFLVEEIEKLTAEEIRTSAESINNSAKNIYNLLENLLQWSRLQTGRLKHNPKEIELGQLIGDVVGLLRLNAASKNILLVSQVKEDAVVYVDQNMINSVIRNLISNAIKFTDRDGTITIRSKPAGDFIEVSVADTGVGMSPEDIEKLFRIDIHHTTRGTAHEKGTGLGLILCKEFIEQNGGQLKVESEPGQGSTFTFSLPQKS